MIGEKSKPAILGKNRLIGFNNGSVSLNVTSSTVYTNLLLVLITLNAASHERMMFIIKTNEKHKKQVFVRTEVCF